LVADDTTISYYKEKSDWSEGPACGIASKPQGVINFSQIFEITHHEDPAKCTNISNRYPKNATHFCLHILTKERTFNIVGFASEKDAQRWTETLKLALRFYNIRKNAKKILRDRSEGVEVLSTEKLRKTMEIPFDKNEIEEQMLFGPNEKQEKKRSPTGNDLQKSIKSYNKNENGEHITIRESHKAPLTYSELGTILEEMDENKASSLTKQLLRKIEEEGELVNLMFTLFQNDPKDFLYNLANISDFEVARFGGFDKLKQLLNR